MVKKMLKAFLIKDCEFTEDNEEVYCKGYYIKKEYFFDVIKEGIKKGVIPKTYVVVLEGDDYISSLKPSEEMRINREERMRENR